MYTKFHFTITIKPDIYALSTADAHSTYANDEDWSATCARIAGKTYDAPCQAFITEDGRCEFDIFCDRDNWWIKPEWIERPDEGSRTQPGATP